MNCFFNDIIVFDYNTTSSVPTVEGSLILAQVEGGSHPVSGFVGDGIQSPMAILDLNNIFDGSTHGNLLLQGGEDLILTE